MANSLNVRVSPMGNSALVALSSQALRKARLHGRILHARIYQERKHQAKELLTHLVKPTK